MSWLTSPAVFYIGLPVFVVAFLTLVLWIMYRATPRTLADDRPANLRAALERLLASGYDRAFAAIDFTSCQKTLQVRKYVHAKGEYGLELSVPLAAWPSSHVRILRDICSRDDVAYAIGPEAPGDMAQFLHADLGVDAAAAGRMVEKIARTIFKLSADIDAVWSLHGVSDSPGVIDDPRRKPPDGHDLIWRMSEINFRPDLSGEARYQLLKRALARHGQSPTDGLWALLWFLAGVLPAIALLYALPWKLLWVSYAVEPVLTAHDLGVLGVPLHPHTFDLVCFALIGAAAAIERMPTIRQMHTSGGRHTRSEVLIRLVVRRGILPAVLAATVVLWFASW